MNSLAADEPTEAIAATAAVTYCIYLHLVGQKLHNEPTESG